MKVVGLDLGTRRIGVAVSVPTTSLAVPHGVVLRSANRATDHKNLAKVVSELGAESVVVGLPLSLDGSIGPAAAAALAEADELRQVLDVPVHSHDERLSTVSADRSLAAAGVNSRARRNRVDQTAAAVILTSWLECHQSVDP